MPFHNEGLPSQSRQEFCLALKATRERKGITLCQIADATKIPASLFAGLERNDLRRWPRGLFRRSFFRDYAKAVGLPLDEACEEFARLFPDECVKTGEAAVESKDVEQNDGVRLAFDVTWHGHREPLRARLKIALLDGMLVMLLALLLMWVKGLTLGSSTATVALGYFLFSTLLFGESATKWAIARRESLIGALGHASSRITPVRRGVIGVFSSVFTQPADNETEATDEPEPREWVSDARRVGVRVKLFQ